MPQNPDITVPSALATGDAGGEYECRVGASCLAMLLTGGFAPLLRDVELSSIRFQTGQLGWKTDDFLLSGHDRSLQGRRLAVQAKRTFYLRASDEDCVKTIIGAWDDYRNPGLFNPEADRIGIFVGQTNAKFSQGMRLLLDVAHASIDSGIFLHRIVLPQHISNDARGCFATIREILGAHAGESLTDGDLWGFLRILDFAVLDLHSGSSVLEVAIKSLLAGTCRETAASALDTWNELNTLSSGARNQAREIRFNDLPLHLRTRHTSSSNAERECLAALNANTVIVRSAANAIIGGRVTLPRHEVVDDILNAFATNDAVVVTGEAGCGKSAVTGMVFDAINKDCLSLALRADTLIEPHLASSFSRLGQDLRQVLRLFTMHTRKLLWVESAERLLEKEPAQREAFGDLLRAFTREGNWKLLVTCRDYNVETFRSALLERAGVSSEVVAVPQLSDADLATAQSALPDLAAPLAEPSIRKLVLNPFFLDLAARMSWSSSTLPANIRDFRQKAWLEVVCKEDEVADGVPLKRDRTMVEVSLRRARALTPYVTSDGLPEEALQRLGRDNLLTCDPTDHTQYAPAHDVYEDWAILQWLTRLHRDVGSLDESFFDRVGTYPALRRTFRRWLTEMLECSPIDADTVLVGLLATTNIAQHWKDDALVAVLQSNEATAFLSRNGAQLLASNSALLRRCVHLLRVACRKIPPALRSAGASSNMVLMPDGAAWDVMPTIVAAALGTLTATDIIWLLSFAEECVTRPANPPSAATSIGIIARFLLSMENLINDRYQDSFRERVLRVMLAVPRVVEAQLRSMLTESLAARGWHGFGRRGLPALIWGHFSGCAVCRELPEMTMSVAENHLELIPSSAAEERARRREMFGSGRLEVDNVFGFSALSSMDHFPASAWRGPFANLLAEHPNRGIDLIVRLLNKACATYGEMDQDIIEKPEQITFRLNDGSELPQWANSRLWLMYRAQSVAPHCLESALMALEEWLLQKAERHDADTLEVFTSLLRTSNNVAVTAVLASVANAYPDFIGIEAMPLLTFPPLFGCDLSRALKDSLNKDGTLEPMLGSSDMEEILLEQERLTSAKKEHRWRHLEHLCVQLQMSPHRERIWALLDEYKTALPPLEQQDDDHRLWRIKLHRMDVRNFVGTRTDDGVIWQATNFPDDLERFRERDLPTHRDHELRTGLFMWGLSAFNREKPEQYPPEQWREKLTAVQNLPLGDDAMDRLSSSGGAAHIVAVCLRDHWDELSNEERGWCIDFACSQFERPLEPDSLLGNFVGSMDGRLASASIIPLVVARDNEPSRSARVLRCLASVVLHPSGEVVHTACRAIGLHLMPAKRNVALSCIAGMLARASELRDFEMRQRHREWDARENEVAYHLALHSRLVDAIEGGLVLDENALLTTDYRRHPHLAVFYSLTSLFGGCEEDALAKRFFEMVASVLAASWRAESHHHHYSNDEDDHLRLSDRFRLNEALARFLLQTSQEAATAILTTLAGVVAEEPNEVGQFVTKLIYAEDRIHAGERFWQAWQIFADAFAQAQLGTRADDENGAVASLLDALLLNISWLPTTREWNTLAGQGLRIRNFFQQLPFSQRAISAFATLVKRFAGEFMPVSLPILAGKLTTQTTGNLLSRFAISQLEEVLGKLVYSGAVDVRRNPALREATLSILDCLVESGSAAAFRIRDDFVTPLRDERR